jgi:hypothetical protein
MFNLFFKSDHLFPSTIVPIVVKITPNTRLATSPVANEYKQQAIDAAYRPNDIFTPY